MPICQEIVEKLLNGSAYLESPMSSTCDHPHHYHHHHRHKMEKYVRNKRCTVIPSSALSAFVYQSISASLSLSLFYRSLPCSLSLSLCPVSLRHQPANRKSWGGSGWHQEMEMMEKAMGVLHGAGIAASFLSFTAAEGRVYPGVCCTGSVVLEQSRHYYRDK